ncbi:Cyclin-dependent kinase F-4, partial [Bienertia sinuspersici]
MRKYKLIKRVGDGMFGSVWRAINKHTREVVAIKMLKKKYCSWEEYINLRKVKIRERMKLEIGSFKCFKPLQTCSSVVIFVMIPN